MIVKDYDDVMTDPNFPAELSQAPSGFKEQTDGLEKFPSSFLEGSEDYDEGEEEEYEEEDSRFLDVCIDGDVEDLVGLMEDMARAGETLGPDMLNCIDATGRVGLSFFGKQDIISE